MSEVLFEMIRMGGSVKVTAVDADSGIEATIVGSAAMTPFSLQQAALRKLRRILEKRASPRTSGESSR